MALRSLNLRVSETDPTPTTSSPTKGRIVQTLRKGLALSFEISVIVLLLCLHLIQLGASLAVALRTCSDKELCTVRCLASTRGLSVIAKFACPPKGESKAPNYLLGLRLCSSMFEDPTTPSQEPEIPTPSGRK